MSSLTRAEIGALGEQLASEYLAAQGLRTLARNWRCRYGELDVIAEEKCAELHLMQHSARSEDHSTVLVGRR
ncbi:YraN family protein, partial [Mycolicibacterium setense]|uniref:YraN family protein n=1 Tax=Mycolicibacterium setense TaxID=431269 RepID=UPI000A748EA6